MLRRSFLSGGFLAPFFFSKKAVYTDVTLKYTKLQPLELTSTIDESKIRDIFVSTISKLQIITPKGDILSFYMPKTDGDTWDFSVSSTG